MYKKKVFTGLIIFIFLLTSLPINENFENSLESVFHTVPFLRGELKNRDGDPGQEPDDFSESISTIKSSIQDNWIQGCSVRVNISSNNHFLLDESLTVSNDAGDTYEIISSVGYSYKDDTNYFSTKFTDANDDEYLSFSLDFVIDTMGRTGTLYYTYHVEGENDIGSAYSYFGVDAYKSSGSITTDMISGDGLLRLRLNFEHWQGVNDFFATWLQSFEADGDISELYSSESDSWGYTTPAWIKLNIDEMRFVADDIIFNQRTEYQYVSSIIQNRVEIENFAYNTEITVNIPQNWEFASIVPSASISMSSNDLTITNTVPASYTVLLSENSSKQYLAISDVSSDYLSDIGFEGSWKNDWQQHPDSPFTSAVLNSTIVSEGTFSLRLSDAEGTTDYLECNQLPSGDYYISFDYYFESYTGSSATLDWWIGVTSQAADFPSVVTSRWHNAFFFIRIKENGYNFVRLRLVSFEGVMFFDNFKVYQVNHQVETIDYAKTKLSGNMNSWTSHGLISLPFQEVTLQLRDRTASTLVKEQLVVSDENGYFFWDFEGVLEQKEYEFRSWSYDSWWGVYSYEYFEDLSMISGVSGSGYTESLDSDSQTGVYSVKLEYGDTSAISFKFDPTPTFDITNSDYFVFDLKANVSSTASTDLYQFLFRSSGSDYYTYNLDLAYYTSWTNYQIPLDFDGNDYSIAGSPDMSAVDYYNPYFAIGAEIHITLYWDSMRFIQTQKSYFTPLPTGSIDYAIQQQEDNPNDYSYWSSDGWDFTEETDDGLYSNDANKTITTENGEYIFERNDYDDSLLYSAGSLSIDASFYTHWIARMKVNDTTKCYLFLLDVDSNNIGGGDDSYTFESANSWEIFEWDIGSDSDWTGIETQIKIYIDHDGNAIKLEIDYWRLAHRDSDLERGYSWEFNEDEYDDGWIIFSGSSISTSNGEITVIAPTQYDGIKFDLETSFSGSDWDHFNFEIKASGITTDLKLCLWLNDVSQVTLSIPTISSTYQIIRMDLESYAFDEIQLRVWSLQTGTFWVKWIHLEKDSPPNLYESFSNFLMKNENSIAYETYSDNIFMGDYYSGDPIPKNLTAGSNTFDYVGYKNNDRKGVYLPSAFYRYDYTVEGTTWSFETLRFMVSDYYLHFSFTTTDGSLSAVVTQNGSGIGTFDENELASWIKPNSPAYYDVEITIGSGSDELVLNYGFRVLGTAPSNTVFDPSYKGRAVQGESITLSHSASYTENIRSAYEYLSTTQIQHYVEWIQVYAGDTVTIYLPPHWSNYSVYPSASLSLSTYDLTISGLMPNHVYTLMAQSGSEHGLDYLHQNQFLAIDDVSSDYLSDIGFEGSWRNDWEELSINTFDSISLNSTIVFDGAFSLRLEDIEESGDLFTNKPNELPSGYYYISFSYYVESFSSGWYFKYKNSDGDWIINALDETTDRWITVFQFMHFGLGGSYGNMYFHFATASGVVFLDNIRLFKVNHQVETIDYSKTRFSGVMRSWDGYANPVVPYQTVEIDLRDRTDNDVAADSTIWSKILETDSNGYFSYDFQGVLNQHEYEFRSWTWDSWFGIYSYEKFEDLSLWSNSDLEFIDSLDGRTVLNLTSTSGSDDVAITFEINLDLTDIDFFVFDLKGSETISSNGDRWKDTVVNTADFCYYQTDSRMTTVTTSWQQFKIDIGYEDISSGTLDYTDIDVFQFYVTTEEWSEYWDNMRFIMAQKSYFTPLPIGYTDYAMKQQEDNPNDYDSYWGVDGWDFSEEMLDGWVLTGGGKTPILNDGYFLTRGKTTGPYFALELSGININSRFLENIVFRFMSNVSNDGSSQGIQFSALKFTPSGGSEWNMIVDYNNNYPILTSYSIFNFDTDDYNSNWGLYIDGNIVTKVRLIFYHYSTGVNFDGNEGFWWDYFRSGYYDSDLDSGYSFEFNEDGYTDGCLGGNGDTVTTESGIAIASSSDTDYIQMGFNGGYLSGTLSIDASVLTHIWFKIMVSDTSFSSISLGDNAGFQILPSFKSSLTANEWFEVIWDLSNDEDWTDIEKQIRISINLDGASTILYVDFLRFISVSPPNLYETKSYFLLKNEDSIAYEAYSDNIFMGHYLSGTAIPINLTIGSNTFDYVAYNNLDRKGVYLPSAYYRYEYSVVGSALSSVVIVDQSNRFLDPRGFKIYVDSVRIYGDTFYWIDTSSTKNITITDIFDNQIYQDTTESYSRFVDVVLTLYSMKIQNLQPDPIWISLKRGSKTFSEWVFSFEIIDYRLEADTYNLTVYYGLVSGNIANTTTNGTTVSYQWSFSNDNAIVVSGNTIADIFGNLISLGADLDNVNSTLHSQIVNVNISLSNQNTDIENQVITVTINLDNVNSSIQSELVDIDTAISNLNTNINLQITDINTTILSINSSIFSQTNDILSNIINVNSTIYTQTLEILSDLSNTNSTIYTQIVNLLSSLSNVNSTIYTQTLEIISNILTVNTTVNTIFSQTVDILIDISNSNSTIYSQTVDIISRIDNNNSTIYAQNLQIISDIYNANATLYSQMIGVITTVNNYNSSVIEQVLNVYAAINNIEPADPNIEITVIEDDQEVIDQINKGQNEIKGEVNFIGSLVGVSIFIGLAAVFLALFKPTEFRKVKAYVDKKGKELKDELKERKLHEL